MTKTLLERTLLPPEIAIESIRVGNTEYTEGRVEIEVSPVGISEFIVFILKDPSDEYVTVTWDPITGNSHLRRGKEQPA